MFRELAVMKIGGALVEIGSRSVFDKSVAIRSIFSICEGDNAPRSRELAAMEKRQNEANSLWC